MGEVMSLWGQKIFTMLIWKKSRDEYIKTGALEG